MDLYNQILNDFKKVSQELDEYTKSMLRAITRLAGGDEEKFGGCGTL